MQDPPKLPSPLPALPPSCPCLEKSIRKKISLRRETGLKQWIQKNIEKNNEVLVAEKVQNYFYMYVKVILLLEWNGKPGEKPLNLSFSKKLELSTFHLIAGKPRIKKWFFQYGFETD